MSHKNNKIIIFAYVIRLCIIKLRSSTRYSHSILSANTYYIIRERVNKQPVTVLSKTKQLRIIFIVINYAKKKH